MVVKKIRTFISHILFIINISADIKSFAILIKIFSSVVIFKIKNGQSNNHYKIKIKGLNKKLDTIFIRSTDYFILYEIFGLEVYKPFVEKITSEGRILDLGGHIGLATIYFRMVLNNPIVIFEPSSKNLILLRKNVASFHDVQIETMAVSNFEGETVFHIYPDQPSRNSLLPEKGNLPTIAESVPVTTLDSILEKYTDCIGIKFDIEGAEKSVFELSTKAQSIPIIMGEIKESEDLSLEHFLGIFSKYKSTVRTIGKKMHLILLVKTS